VPRAEYPVWGAAGYFNDGEGPQLQVRFPDGVIVETRWFAGFPDPHTGQVPPPHPYIRVLASGLEVAGQQLDIQAHLGQDGKTVQGWISKTGVAGGDDLTAKVREAAERLIRRRDREARELTRNAAAASRPRPQASTTTARRRAGRTRA
jgi:hypothetical protein